MDPREIVDAYLHGRIESWGVFRRLTRLGLSTATALAVAAALPAAVRANDAEALKEVGQSAQESPVLDLLMSHLASQLEKVEAGGPIRPLAATLARIGGNNTNLNNNNDCNIRQCDPIKLNLNDGHNNINGELVPDPKGNLMLNLNGSIGQSNLNLVGTLDRHNIVSPRDPARRQQHQRRQGQHELRWQYRRRAAELERQPREPQHRTQQQRAEVISSPRSQAEKPGHDLPWLSFIPDS